jgi:cytidylate kinase
MAIILISSESEMARARVAERLAERLGCECLCHEDFVREAMAEGIPVDKVEAAIIKSPAVSERLARQKEHYLSFITCLLCRRSEAENLVYHGRAGIFLLQGIPHILRIRLVVDKETRVEEAMDELGLAREKAERHVTENDENFRKWARHFYRSDIDDMTHYDLIVNLTSMGVDEACEMLYGMAGMPHFALDEGSRQGLESRSLEMRARMNLVSDDRTAHAGFKARAEKGIVTVTYQPSQRHLAEMIPKILEGLKGCTELVCTMAESNILWVQESFDPDSEVFHQIIEIARRWDAAIELVRFVAVTDPPRPPDDLDDDEKAMAQTIEALVGEGRYGGARTIRGDSGELAAAIRGDVKYGLIAIGECFSSRPDEVRTRLLRELAGHITERVDAPVVTTDELQQKYLVGPRQIIKASVCAIATAIIYFLVFHFQQPVLSFLSAPGPVALKVVRVAAVVSLVPLIAYLYSAVTSLFLKILRFE